MKKTTLMVCAGVLSAIIGGSSLSAEKVWRKCPAEITCIYIGHGRFTSNYGCDGYNGGDHWTGDIKIPYSNPDIREFGDRFQIGGPEAALQTNKSGEQMAFCEYQGYNGTVHVNMKNRSVNSRCTPQNNEEGTGFWCPS